MALRIHEDAVAAAAAATRASQPDIVVYDTEELFPCATAPEMDHAVEKRRIQCDVCSLTYSDRGALRRHRKRKHSTTAPGTTGTPDRVRYHCSVCDQAFTDPSARRRHEDSIHRGLHFMCPHCFKTFKQRYSVTRHLHRRHPALPFAEPWHVRRVDAARAAHLDPEDCARNSFSRETSCSSDGLNSRATSLASSVCESPVPSRQTSVADDADWSEELSAMGLEQLQLASPEESAAAAAAVTELATVNELAPTDADPMLSASVSVTGSPAIGGVDLNGAAVPTVDWAAWDTAAQPSPAIKPPMVGARCVPALTASVLEMHDLHHAEGGEYSPALASPWTRSFSAMLAV